jgi:hypothetical protein
LEDLTLDDLSVILLERFVSFDPNQIFEQVLHVICQVCAKVFDRLARLYDLLNLFSLKMLGQVRAHRHNLLPYIHDAHSEAQWIIDEENCTAQLE